MTDEPGPGSPGGRLVRPYAVSNGRTEPAVQLDLLSIVLATGQVEAKALAVEHARVLELCQTPVAVAEVATELRLPVIVVKVLLSDLIECQAVIDHPPGPATDGPDISELEKVLNALRAL